VLVLLAAASTVIATAGGARAAATQGAPATFATYAGPAALVSNAGEPSIGSNWKSGATLLQATTTTARVTFDDTATPPAASWVDASYPGAVTSLDAILYTDSAQGHTVASQLLTACSIGSTTNDDGANWTPGMGCATGAAFDHQTIGGGPYAASTAPVVHPLYPNAVYYCAQYVVSANCGRSDDGGTTFGPAVPVYNVANTGDNCAGLHGHLRVGPDGTAYLPNFDCAGSPAVTVSRDNGATWTVHHVTTTATTQDESDPSVAVGSGGTVYAAWEDGGSNDVGSTIKVAVSGDHGANWTSSTDVGSPYGISNVQFPETIAGDDNRAAVAFLGTPTAGNDQAQQSATAAGFQGVWHLYVALTYDRGLSWQTQDLTPADPVQRGCIWLNGGSSECRNLLDFNDITVDKKGRVEVAYADGCIAACVAGDPATGRYNDSANAAAYRASLGSIARQYAGKGLFAQYDAELGADGPAAAMPEAPLAAVLPVLGGAVGFAVLVRRRRRA